VIPRKSKCRSTIFHVKSWPGFGKLHEKYAAGQQVIRLQFEMTYTAPSH
jgi:hypothetical protein